MRYQLTAEQTSFKEEVEAFLSASLPAATAAKVRSGAGVDKAELAEWTRILNARGWAAPNWPAEHGGTGWKRSSSTPLASSIFWPLVSLTSPASMTIKH